MLEILFAHVICHVYEIEINRTGTAKTTTFFENFNILPKSWASFTEHIAPSFEVTISTLIPSGIVISLAILFIK